MALVICSVTGPTYVAHRMIIVKYEGNAVAQTIQYSGAKYKH